MTNNKFIITECNIESEKISKSLTVVQISDLHNCCGHKRNNQIIKAIKESTPNFVVCTGDLFNRKDVSRSHETFDFLQSIIELFPTFVIEGNHEAALGTTGDSYLQKLQKMGAHVLINEAVSFCGIRLIGLREQPEIMLINQLASDELFNLVLSHRPERFPDYVKTKADLVLSGHAHGGQIRIGMTSLYAPEQGILPKYTSGLYEMNQTKMYVSRGLGDTIIIPRINNPHELNIIHLLPAER